MFPTTIAGSLPKPSWLAEPDKLWPQWRLTGAELAAGKLDATLLAVKLQEDAGIDIVTDGEQSRQHFVHGFLEFVDGIDFGHKVEEMVVDVQASVETKWLFAEWARRRGSEALVEFPDSEWSS